MLSIKDVEDAWKVDAKANITGIKTTATHEKEFDAQTLAQIMPLSPFILFRWGGLKPEPSERMANEASGIKKARFFLSVGASSLLSKQEGQAGCYAILDELIHRYDGGQLTTDDGSISLALEDADFLWGAGGLMVYGMEFSYYEI